MKSGLLPFIIMFPFMSAAFAVEDYHSIINDLIKINKEELMAPPAPQCLNGLMYTESIQKKRSSPLFNQCAVDLCGPPGKNKSVWITDLQFSSSAPKKVLSQVEKLSPTISAVFDHALKKNKAELIDLKNYTKKTSQELAALPLVKREELAELFFTPYLDIHSRPEGPIEERLEITIRPPQNASPEMRAALNDYAQNLKRSAFMNPIKFSFYRIYSDEDIAFLAKNAFSKISAFIDLHKKTLSPEVLQKADKINQTIKSNNLLQYGMAVLEIEELNQELAKSFAQTPLPTPTCDAPACTKVFEQFLKDPGLQKNLLRYEGLLSDPKARSRAIDRCKAGLIVGATRFSESKEAQKVFNAAKDSIIKKVLPRFSEHSRKIMLSYLNNKLEMNNKNLRVGGEQGPLKRFEGDATDFLNDEFMEDAKDDLSSLQKLFVIKNSFDEIDPLDGALPCGTSNTPSNAWDSFLPLQMAKKYTFNDVAQLLGDKKETDRVFVSDFSCQNQAHGKHNVAHEISHALNYLFASAKLSQSSLERYNKIRQCAVSNYPGAQPALTYGSHAGDVLSTEEDTADLFAFMSNPTDKTLYSCELLRPSLTSDSYADLDLLGHGEDPHSTGIVRVLFESINKGIPLPSSCKDLLLEEKPSMRFNKCI